MISANQIKGARAMLGLDQRTLAKMAGVAPGTVNSLENGASFRSASANAIERALSAAGARFGADGSVKIVPKRSQFVIEPGQGPDAETVRPAKMIINADRRAKG